MPRFLQHRGISFIVVAAGLFATGHAVRAGDINVRDVWSRATPPGIEVGVAYLVIDNRGKPDRLLAASSPVAKRTELHISEMKNGMMQMRHLDAVDIKAGAATAFAPGGRHIMLIGLKRPLKQGDTFPLTLKFRNAGRLRVMVHVLGIGQNPEKRR